MMVHEVLVCVQNSNRLHSLHNSPKMIHLPNMYGTRTTFGQWILPKGIVGTFLTNFTAYCIILKPTIAKATTCSYGVNPVIVMANSSTGCIYSTILFTAFTMKGTLVQYSVSWLMYRYISCHYSRLLRVV